jgi:uncharacterized protein (TIGR03435 family)
MVRDRVKEIQLPLGELVTEKRWLGVGVWGLVWVAVLFATPGGQAQEKDIAGKWQGTLDIPGHPLRIVVEFSKDNGALKATIYSIDQKAQFSASSVTEQAGTVKVGMTALGATYEGKLTSDGQELDGNWTQGGALPLNLKHVTEAAAWAIPEPAKKLEPMAATADPGIEVATIKPSRPDAHGIGMTLKGQMLVTANTSVVDLIALSYGVNKKQIAGVAPWMENERYDITLKPDTPGVPNEKQYFSMVKKLLAERFQLKFHMEKKELAVYALELGKGEPKLTKADANAGNIGGVGFGGLGKLFVQNAPLAEFTGILQHMVLDRPVVDQTGLTGRWNFTLNWTPDESQFSGMGIKIPPPSDKADAPPPLFTAIQEQLGLKLEATKAPVDVLAVDKVEKPSDN